MSLLTPYTKRNSILSLLHDDITRLLDPTENDYGWSQMLSGEHMLTDIIEHDDRFEVIMDAPGYKSTDINIHVDENRLLTITGNRESISKETKKGKYLHLERKNTEFFSRKIVLPDFVNKELIKADYKKGVLTITLPKLQEKENGKLHKIKISDLD